MIFAFEFQLTIDKLTKPAAEAKKSVDAVRSSMVAFKKATESADSATTKTGQTTARMAKETATSGRKIADEWQRMAAKVEREEQRMTSAREREAAKRQAAQEREARTTQRTQERAAAQSVKLAEKAERQRLAVIERENKAGERMWTRVAFASQRAQDRAQAMAAKAAARAADLAAHKPWFGGKRSVMELLSSRAEAKVSGMATGIADAALGMPGMIAGGIGGVALGGIKMAAGAALDLVSFSADAATNFAKMAISAQALREQSVAGFAAIYGNAGVADKLFDQAVRIAKLTKFDTPEVVQRFNDLAAGGFTAQQLPMMFAAVADVQSARGENYGSRYSTAVQKLNAQPSALFTTFQQAAMAGPGLKLAEQVLADRLGLKSNNIDADLRKMFREKKISGGAAINAILQSTSERYDQGGMLGGFSRAQGEGTWEGLISNIRNGLQDVLTMKLPDGHPMLKFKGILREVNSLFDEQTQRGQRFQRLMSKLVDDVFMVFNIDKDQTGKAMENLLGLAEALETKVRSVAEWIRDKISSPLTEGLSGDFGASLQQSLKRGFIDLGILAGKAFAAGAFEAMGMTGKAAKIKEGIHQGAVRDAAIDQIESDRERVKRFKAAPSEGEDEDPEWLKPRRTKSQINAELTAEETADAAGLPKLARGGYVTKPTIALIGEVGPEVVAPAGRMGGITITGGVHIHLPGGSMTGYTEMDAQRLGTAFMGWLAQQGA